MSRKGWIFLDAFLTTLVITIAAISPWIGIGLKHLFTSQ